MRLRKKEWTWLEFGSSGKSFCFTFVFGNIRLCSEVVVYFGTLKDIDTKIAHIIVSRKEARYRTVHMLP